MRKVINIFMLLLCVCIVSCDDSNDNAEEITITKRDTNIAATGGSLTVTLSTEGDKAISDKSWCVATVSGNVVNITLEANTALEGRTAMVTVFKGTDRLSFPITQPGNLVPTAEVDNVDFDAHGGSQQINVRNAIPFTATSQADWLSTEVNGSTLILTAEPNYTDKAISTTVKLVSEGLESEFTVTQTGIEMIPEVTALSISNTGDEVSIKVNSTLPFTAVSDKDWLIASFDNNSVTLKALPNSVPSARSAKVTLTSETLTATISVVQSMYPDYIGNWTLTGINGGNSFTYDLTIEQAAINSTYKVTGWGKSIVATDRNYAIQANFDPPTGLIYITAQENIGVYSDEEGSYDVMFYGYVDLGGNSVPVTGNGYICYIGMLQSDGTVQWDNGEVTIGNGATYEVVGGMYRIKNQSTGTMYGFNVDSPFMRQPVMKKVNAFSNRSAMKLERTKVVVNSQLHVQK